MALPQVKHPAGFPACVELSIKFQPHATMYQTVEQWLADYDDGEDSCCFDWVSPDARQRAIDTNSLWICQWYPRTPVGFCALAAASYEALMAAVNAHG